MPLPERKQTDGRERGRPSSPPAPRTAARALEAREGEEPRAGAGWRRAARGRAVGLAVVSPPLPRSEFQRRREKGTAPGDRTAVPE